MSRKEKKKMSRQSEAKVFLFSLIVIYKNLSNKKIVIIITNVLILKINYYILVIFNSLFFHFSIFFRIT